MKRSLFFLFILILLSYLISMPREAFAASTEGLNLWFHSVLPSLLPFCILSDILIRTGRISGLLRPLEPMFSRFLGLSSSGAYAFLLGLFCGYPMGARLTGELYRQGEISHQEAQYLLSFCNNASPVFLMTYLIHDQLDPSASGHATLMLVIFYTSLYLTSVFLRIFYKVDPSQLKKKKQNTEAKRENLPSTGFSEVVDRAIMNGFEVVTRLGGYIILFSITASLIGHLTVDFPMISPLLTGFIEITNGIHAIACSAFPVEWKYTLVWTITSFGGLSTLAQTKGMLNGTPLSLSSYLIGKFIHTALTFAFCVLIFVVKIIHI